jgi:hypothetical protein
VKLIWWFLPEELWPWLGLGLLLAWLAGLVSLRTLLAFALLFLLGPFIVEALPTWAQYGLLLLLGLAFLRDLLAFFVGDRAADHAIGEFVGYLLKVLFTAALLPFRVAARIARLGFRLIEERWL